ncbi:MAG TPA: AAA family ATPase, partial [Haploplasma sp.]|nr:AAA family ATPase [Haploplasma sp.]
MIKSINIKDFALIQDIDINFFDGLTVLTGETGAGKSIILESLHLLFAKRSDQEMIRHGKDRAIVSGVFSLNKVQQELFDLPEEIFISREIDKSGRHKISINNQVTTLGRLKEITETIGSIHSQNDTFLLLDNNEYLNFIDQVDQKEVTKLLSNYLISRSNYLDLKKHLEKIKQKKQSDIEQKDFLQYQIEELNSFNLVLGEKEELELSYEKLKHFDKISNSLKETYYELDNNVNIALLYN